MRKAYHAQLPLAPSNPHAWGDELRMMSQLLDANLGILGKVRADLSGVEKANAKAGRPGLTAEQVVRAALLKQMWDLPYEDLAFHLSDSVMLRWFCRIGPAAEPPKKSTLQQNIAAISAETWEAVNQALVLDACARKVEDGRWMRTDATVVESNIHHPMDSSLLYDCVRTLTRIMRKAHELYETAYCNHRRVAKHRSVAILNARGDEQRTPLYRDLIGFAKTTLATAEAALLQLPSHRAYSFAAKLAHYIPLVKKVISQAERRVIHGEIVPVADKIVSIFEPHTDIIRKDRRDTYYGHKVTLSTGRSGMVLDAIVEDGNPADATLAVRASERHQALFGVVPERAAFDGSYASKDNLKAMKKAGTAEVCFSKPCGLPLEEMTSTPRIRRVLKNFRAGIEATVSFLKRSFGLSRCTWHGLPRFKAYTWCSVVSHNLLLVARDIIDKEKRAKATA
jgi:transposase, IS5 family